MRAPKSHFRSSSHATPSIDNAPVQCRANGHDVAIAGLRKIGNGQLNRVIGGHLAQNSDTLSNEERVYWEGVRRAFGL